MSPAQNPWPHCYPVVLSAAGLHLSSLFYTPHGQCGKRLAPKHNAFYVILRSVVKRFPVRIPQIGGCCQR